MNACIILAHGSVRKQTNLVMDALIAQLQQRPETKDLQLRTAYLQLAEPNLETVAEQLYADGCRQITLVPLFIFDGVHVTKDIPELCQRLEIRLEGLRLKLNPHIGADPLLTQIIINRLFDREQVPCP